MRARSGTSRLEPGGKKPIQQQAIEATATLLVKADVMILVVNVQPSVDCIEYTSTEIVHQAGRALGTLPSGQFHGLWLRATCHVTEVHCVCSALCVCLPSLRTLLITKRCRSQPLEVLQSSGYGQSMRLHAAIAITVIGTRAGE